MSFSGSTKARRFAMDGQLAALFVGLRKQVQEPAEQRAVEMAHTHCAAALRDAPIDGDITFDVSGSFNNDGTGALTLKYSIGPHIDDRPPAEVAAEAAAPVDEESVAAPDA